MDASYAIHDDCIGHTGAMMNLDEGAVASFHANKSLMQNIPWKQSLLEWMMHCPKYFLEDQGYMITSNILLYKEYGNN